MHADLTFRSTKPVYLDRRFFSIDATWRYTPLQESCQCQELAHWRKHNSLPKLPLPVETAHELVFFYANIEAVGDSKESKIAAYLLQFLPESMSYHRQRRVRPPQAKLQPLADPRRPDRQRFLSPF